MAQPRIPQASDCNGLPMKKELGNSSCAPGAKHEAVAHTISSESKRRGVIFPDEAFSPGGKRRQSVDNGIWNADEEFGEVVDIVPNTFLANEHA